VAAQSSLASSGSCSFYFSSSSKAASPCNSANNYLASSMPSSYAFRRKTNAEIKNKYFIIII